MNANIQNNIVTLNQKKYISSLEPLTYSMLINNIDYSKKQKNKSEYTFIDLVKLVDNFKLNTSFNGQLLQDNNECQLGTVLEISESNSGFISKKYYTTEYAYSYPPVGPIPKCFRCAVCKNKGPEFHTITCSDPFDYSLYLTSRGSELLSQKKKKFPVEYAHVVSTEENTAYTDLVRKRGQKKIQKKSVKSRKFENNVQIRYQDSNLKQCIIRVSKNGAVNIISAQFNNSQLPQLVINNINESGSVLLDEYNKVYPGNDKMTIDKDITYKYLIQAQFHIIPNELRDYIDINLNELYENILEEKMNIISHLEYNSGDRTSKSGKQTNPILQFNINIDNFNVNVSVYKKGAIQLRGSYVTKESNDELNIELLQNGYSIIKPFIENCKRLYIPNYNFKTKDSNEYSTIDSGKPKECREADRPVPYSFKGKCKEGYYVAPWGKKRRSDGLYEPCCYKITKNGESSVENIKKTVLNGFPNEQQAIKYEIDDPDTKAAVFYPGTNVRYQRRFKGLNDLNTNELYNVVMSNSFGINQKMLYNYEKYLYTLF